MYLFILVSDYKVLSYLYLSFNKISCCRESSDLGWPHTVTNKIGMRYHAEWFKRFLGKITVTINLSFNLMLVHHVCLILKRAFQPFTMLIVNIRKGSVKISTFIATIFQMDY